MSAPLHPGHGRLALLPCAALLGGCDMVLLHPSGDVAAQQGHLVVVSTLLMLLIIVPVIVLTLLFAWRYRQSNRAAVYEPDWDHSIQLELLIWAAPLVIIIALGALTWIGTHTLDPFRPLRRLDAERPVVPGTPRLTVEAVALDWKWLFIYPELGIAVVNELAAPVDVPIEFKITASSVMNSFFIPALAGQIYAMPGMETQLHAVINRAGNYEGFSANYSGAGFSDMRFRFHGLDAAQFEHWVQTVKAGGGALTRSAYLKLQEPTAREPVRRYASVAAGLYDRIVNRCVEDGQPCMRKTMAMTGRAGDTRLAAGNLSLPAQVCTAADPDGTRLTLADRK
jgi:cytochrome o ubiquinol oxidase subunit 2